MTVMTIIEMSTASVPILYDLLQINSELQCRFIPRPFPGFLWGGVLFAKYGTLSVILSECFLLYIAVHEQ